ncbi:hypothetical protein [Pectobacterium carotovorum]|nr:hypothetical protein [Pectobacterium carotovorum]
MTFAVQGKFFGVRDRQLGDSGRSIYELVLGFSCQQVTVRMPKAAIEQWGLDKFQLLIGTDVLVPVWPDAYLGIGTEPQSVLVVDFDSVWDALLSMMALLRFG